MWAGEYSAENDDWLYLGKTPFTTNELQWATTVFASRNPGFKTS